MSCSSSSGSEEDDEGMDSYRKGGYHAVRVGDQFASGRYIAQKKLGWGQFSTVWLAYDTQSSKYVALKIQKSAAQFAQAALHEIAILSAIAEKDPSHSRCVVHLIDHFKHSGPNGQHPCMVLEFLGDSLLRLIKYNRYRGLEMNKVREICRCILIGLDYLHRDLGILHTDLKPENILLNTTIDASKDPIRSGTAPIIERPEGSGYTGVSMNIIEKKLKRRAKRAVAKISARRSPMGEAVAKSRRNMDGIDVKCKIVDFGNACWADKPFAEEIQTRQYRAPEVVLQSGYSFSVDMWSFACTAFELATGDMLFTPKEGHGFSEDEDHLALMMELLGKIPKKIATGGASSKDFFDKYGDLKRIRRLKYWSLDQLLMDRYKFPEADAREFSEFLCPLLDFAPEKRPTAQQCLQHPWLKADDANQKETLNNTTLDNKTPDNKTQDHKTENNKTQDHKTENNRTLNPKTLDSKTENNRTQDNKTENNRTQDNKTENNRTLNPKTLDSKTDNNRTPNDKTENNRIPNDKTQHEEHEEHSVSRVGASVAKLEINQVASESKVQKILNRYRKV